MQGLPLEAVGVVWIQGVGCTRSPGFARVLGLHDCYLCFH